ncbi:MAG: right-handed parallel beta-helix repeat-containing protein [Chloroflexi bacterium]|nr:right-handed parallel beta-helix repeat-containing protein [Chloroflexota bacterium]
MKFSKLLASLFILFIAACSTPQPTPTELPTQTARMITATRARTATATNTVTPSATTAMTPTASATETPTTISTPTITPLPTASPTPSVTPTMLGGCAEIWQSGFYKMYADFKTTLKRFDCMIVQASDVVIDCDAHTIEGLNKQGHGFWIRRYGFPILQTPNNIEIRNCFVKNARDGVFAEAATNLWIHNNDFSNNYDDVDNRRYGIFLGMAEGGGIRLNHSQNVRIENNTTSNSAIGIDIRESQQVLIKNNTAINNSAWGVSLLNTQDSEVSYNTLRDNVRYCTWGNGTVGPGCDAAAVILQDGASRNVVKNNLITGQNANGVFIKAHGVRCGDNNTIQNNKITDVMYNAIEFSFCKDNKIIGNDISGSLDGVWFGFSTNTTIADNIIRNMNNHGIISYNSRDSIVRNNQIVNAREGIYFYWDTWNAKQFYFLTPTPDQYASKGNLIEANTLRDNTVAGIRLTNSIQNRILNNIFANNSKTVWVEGKNDGNVINGQ